MTRLVIDCAVAGAWDFRDPWNHPRQGQCVRLAYIACSTTGVFAEGVLIVRPGPKTVVTGENTMRGGVTFEGLRAEGKSHAELAEDQFWRLAQDCEMLLSYAQDFHVGLLDKLALACRAQLADAAHPRFIDICRRITPIVGLPHPTKPAPGRFKTPSLVEAVQAVSGLDLVEQRDEAAASDRPVAAWGLVQVWSVFDLWQHMVPAERRIFRPLRA